MSLVNWFKRIRFISQEEIGSRVATETVPEEEEEDDDENTRDATEEAADGVTNLHLDQPKKKQSDATKEKESNATCDDKDNGERDSEEPPKDKEEDSASKSGDVGLTQSTQKLVRVPKSPKSPRSPVSPRYLKMFQRPGAAGVEVSLRLIFLIFLEVWNYAGFYVGIKMSFLKRIKHINMKNYCKEQTSQF